MRKIYLASSWRNPSQPHVVRDLRHVGHEVYDFRNPVPGNKGFAWSDIDPHWLGWGPKSFRSALNHPLAVQGYGYDFDAMTWADTFVLLLPCGRSAHLEAGWAIGSGRPSYILLSGADEPELMYKLATGICVHMRELLDQLSRLKG